MGWTSDVHGAAYSVDATGSRHVLWGCDIVIWVVFDMELAGSEQIAPFIRLEVWKGFDGACDGTKPVVKHYVKLGGDATGC